MTSGHRYKKIRDMRIVGTSNVIQCPQFENIWLRIVGLVRVQTFLEVRSRDSTWWPDLSWPRVKIFTQMRKRWGWRSVKTRRRYTPRFFSYLQKTYGACTRPPARRGLKKRGHYLISTFNPRTAGGTNVPLPANSKTTQLIDKREMALGSS